MATTISAPVGPWDDPVVQAKSGNRAKDIETVQKLLIKVAKASGNRKFDPGTPDGEIARAPKASNTLNAIQAFQAKFLKSPDKRVDVGGTTWKRLLKAASEETTTNLLYIDDNVLLAFCSAMMDGHCSYGFGKKANPLSAKPKDVTSIDCSGFVRYLLYQVTGGQLRIPDGSWNQDAWFNSQGFERVKYEECKKLDGVLRMGYFNGTPGHIWFVKNGRTIESHGSKGPNRRDWGDAALKPRVKRCYVVSGRNAVNSSGALETMFA